MSTTLLPTTLLDDGAVTACAATIGMEEPRTKAGAASTGREDVHDGIVDDGIVDDVVVDLGVESLPPLLSTPLSDETEVVAVIDGSTATEGPELNRE